MFSSRPYLIRALYEWLADNSLTPYIAVDATLSDVMVPEQHVRDGQIVLNIAMSAVRELELSNEAITFSARFGGVPQQVYIPVAAVLAIYAMENGQGMAFGHEPELSEEEAGSEPALDLVEDTVSSADSAGEAPASDRTEDTPETPAKPSGRPSLRVVK